MNPDCAHCILAEVIQIKSGFRFSVLNCKNALRRSFIQVIQTPSNNDPRICLQERLQFGVLRRTSTNKCVNISSSGVSSREDQKEWPQPLTWLHSKEITMMWYYACNNLE